MSIVAKRLDIKMPLSSEIGLGQGHVVTVVLGMGPIQLSRTESGTAAPPPLFSLGLCLL